MSTGFTPGLRDERLRGARGDDRRQRDREVADAGLERREAEHLLHVEREQEEHAEDDRPQPEADDVRAGRRPPAEEARAARAASASATRSRGRRTISTAEPMQDADRLAGAPAVVGAWVRP